MRHPPPPTTEQKESTHKIVFIIFALRVILKRKHRYFRLLRTGVG